MSIENAWIYLIRNLLLILVNKRFMAVFFEKKGEKLIYDIFFIGFYFLITSVGFLTCHRLEINILTNIVGLFAVTIIYLGSAKKKILMVFLIYALNMTCDVIIMTLFTGINILTNNEQILGSITVFLIMVCEIIIEKIYLKKNSTQVAPHWFLFLIIPLCSIGMLHYFVTVSPVRNVPIVGGGVLLIINIILFYLYSAMESTYADMSIRCHKRHAGGNSFFTTRYEISY